MSLAALSVGTALLVTLVSLAGAAFARGILRTWADRNLIYLATFAAGVFVVVVFRLVSEALHEGSAALVLGAILLGAGMMEALHHLFPAHHHHATTHDHRHTVIDGRRVLASDALHNVGDGVLLVAAYAVSVPIGVTATIGIVIHELVQEVSEYFILIEAGYSPGRALALNLGSASTIFIGVALALFLSSAEAIAVLFAGLAAGGFLAVLSRDLIPHALGSIRERGGASIHAAALLAGIALMLSLQYALPHEHPTKTHQPEMHD